MHMWFSLYCGLYVVLAVGGIHDSYQNRLPKWVLTVEALTLLTMVTGLVLYQLQTGSASVRVWWAMAFWYLLGSEVLLFVYEIRWFFVQRDPEYAFKKNRLLVSAMCIVGWALVVPALYFNYRYAFP